MHINRKAKKLLAKGAVKQIETLKDFKLIGSDIKKLLLAIPSVILDDYLGYKKSKVQKTSSRNGKRVVKTLPEMESLNSIWFGNTKTPLNQTS